MDFTFINHGSVVTIEACSEKAMAFAEEHLQVEDWMGSPTRFTTDWRPARDLAERLSADGFSIGGT